MDSSVFSGHAGSLQDIDSVTDYYDVVRMYQFPVDGVFAVTTMYKKKWRRIVVRPPAQN